MLKINNLSKIALLFAILFIGCKEFIEPSIDRKNVVLLAPSNGAESSIYNQTFWWEEVEDALKYRLQLVTPSFDKTTRLLLDTVIRTNKFKFPLDPGQYEWRVRAENGSSKTAYVSASFTIHLSSIKQQQVQLLAPANHAVTTEASAIFKWSSLYGANKYRLQIDTNNFADESQLFLDKTISNLEFTVVFNRQKVYQWRVQGKNDTAESKWSELRDVKFDKSPPAKVELISPANNVVVSKPVNLKWAALATAKKYMLYVYQTNGKDPYDKTFPVTLTATSYSFVDGLVGEKLFWAVRAVDEAGNPGPYSELRSFIIQ
ncbi:hypothetical protein SAMN05421820_107156 [Pedobacter steynii]|uniref:Fibronectin type-III domain-containing protein n=1 Tax=Pedobacter steynii TaxID=430522 RepID=A0A1H0ANN4_9SPHI|nr:hypothetical protein [Pedobacter steynii]NQX41302.1 hypothetical protein [Pedobacter steynii]SDN35168.1 hypothetical protein SAMN05421820_107156 [Pedobacter steynii]